MGGLNKICTPTVEQTEYYLSGGFLSGDGKMAPTKDLEMLTYEDLSETGDFTLLTCAVNSQW